jgi:pyruvate-formate lyase-activating enzyme
MEGDGLRYRFMTTMLFDTCSHKCSYCHYAETGKVLDAAQLNPYRDEQFTNKIAAFFRKRTTETERWLFLLSGGEPLLMPNFERFCSALTDGGNKICLNTALLVGTSAAAFRYLVERAAPSTEYIFASLHPESEVEEDKFFERVAMLKDAGHGVMVRYICHPDRIKNLDHVAEWCRRLDVAFVPTCMFSPTYPSAYTEDEREAISRHFSSLGEVIAMEGGLDTAKTQCHAGSRMFHSDLRTGDIQICASIGDRIIGNIYEDRLEAFDGVIACPAAGKIGCNCNAFFQQDMVVGAEDGAYFARQKRGFVEPIPLAQLKEEVLRYNGFKGGQFVNMGQVETSNELIMPKEMVKNVYLRNKDYLHGAYSEAFHPAYRGRLGRQATPGGGADEAAAATGKQVPSPLPAAPPSRLTRFLAPLLARFG